MYCPWTIQIVFRAISLLGLVSLLLSLPLLLYGPMVQGHDTFEHINYTKNFANQVWAGELYPRWLLGIHHGLGSPVFFVFPPLPSYVCTFIQPLTNIFRVNTLASVAFLSLFGSGTTALLWLQTMVSRRVAIAAAVLYMLMPYHLTADVYRRFALPECWAFVWIPLLLYFNVRIIAGKRGATLGLAVTYALMIFSHLISVVICSPVLLAANLALSPRGQKLSSLFRLALGTILGVGLSSVYLLPALYHSRYFPVSRLLILPEYKLTSHIIWFSKALFVHSNESNFTRVMAFFVLDMVLLIAVCGIFAYRKARPELRPMLVFWLAVCVPTVFLMLGLSYPLWRAFPSLAETIQFPWRFNVVLCVAALPIIAIFLSEMSWESRLIRIFMLSFASLLIAAWLLSYGVILMRYKTETEVPIGSAHIVNEYDGWFSSWTPPGVEQSAALNNSFGPKVKFIEGVGNAEVSLWKPRHIEFQVDSLAGGWVMVNQFFYPAWKAELAGQIGPIEIRPAMPEGLLEMHVPPGNHQILLEIPVGMAERLGRWISASCLLLSLSWLFTVWWRPQYKIIE